MSWDQKPYWIRCAIGQSATLFKSDHEPTFQDENGLVRHFSCQLDNPINPKEASGRLFEAARF